MLKDEISLVEEKNPEVVAVWISAPCCKSEFQNIDQIWGNFTSVDFDFGGDLEEGQNCYLGGNSVSVLVAYFTVWRIGMCGRTRVQRELYSTGTKLSLKSCPFNFFTNLAVREVICIGIWIYVEWRMWKGVEDFIMHNGKKGERNDSEEGERVSEKCGLQRGSQFFQFAKCRGTMNMLIVQNVDGHWTLCMLWKKRRMIRISKLLYTQYICTVFLPHFLYNLSLFSTNHSPSSLHTIKTCILNVVKTLILEDAWQETFDLHHLVQKTKSFVEHIECDIKGNNILTLNLYYSLVESWSGLSTVISSLCQRFKPQRGSIIRKN